MTTPTGVWYFYFRDMQLRPYQSEMLDAIAEQHKKVRSTLLVAATGTGKTVVFGEYARRCGGRALVIAHRQELVDQATATLERLGLHVQREQAENYARRRSLFSLDGAVVASVQTLGRDYRLKEWPNDAFTLIIEDECHRSVNKSYKAIREHFSSAKVLGVTATPDRGDGRAMARAFESVAYRYEIRKGIDDGYLAPIVAKVVMVEELELDGVKVTAGDFQNDALSAEMSREAVLEGIAGPLLAESGARKTLVFGPTVAFAHALAEKLNKREPGCALALDGSMDKDERRASLKDMTARILVNCMLFTEGYDDPEIACVAVCRPTKSRALYTQMTGRGTRPCPLCPVPIAAPCIHKPDLLLLDFTGVSKKHSLIGPVDVLAGCDDDPKVVTRAKKIVEKSNGAIRLEEALARAVKDVRLARLRYKANKFDPFRHNEELRMRERVWSNGMTANQAQLLIRFGVPERVLQQQTQRSAGKLIGQLIQRAQSGLCSWRQAEALAKLGFTKEQRRVMSRDQAKIELTKGGQHAR